MPMANMPMMLAIGETFFLSSQQHSSVTPTAARPGMRLSRLAWSVVTFSTSRPVAPSEENWDSALWMASATPWPPFSAVSAMAVQSM